ncbi:hypothetical protein [Nannocystis pusilla]|uniref:hypothetical protein n=1 Tax=Nannocystis pusilla TaxID=889268 RepID=UPI003B7ADA8F
MVPEGSVAPAVVGSELTPSVEPVVAPSVVPVVGSVPPVLPSVVSASLGPQASGKLPRENKKARLR